MAIKNVSDLSDQALDWAVAVAEDFKVAVTAVSKLIIVKRNNITDYYNPSTNWGWGGPIIEREKIAIRWFESEKEWEADVRGGFFYQYGETPLIAAMRCYVASKLGSTIDIPEEIK